MAKERVDGVVEAVHYSADGQIEWVRAYERRGKIFSDVVLIRREQLAQRLKKGEHLITGQRKFNFGGMFSQGTPLKLVADGKAIQSSDAGGQLDNLPDVPVL